MKLAAQASKRGDSSISKSAGVKPETVARWRREFGVAAPLNRKAGEEAGNINLDAAPEPVHMTARLAGVDYLIAGGHDDVRNSRWSRFNAETSRTADAWRGAAEKCREGFMSVEAAADVYHGAAAVCSGINRALERLSETAASDLQVGEKEEVVLSVPDGAGEGEPDRWKVARGAVRLRWDHDGIWQRLNADHACSADSYDARLFEHKANSGWNVGALYRIVGSDIHQMGKVVSEPPAIIPHRTSDRASISETVNSIFGDPETCYDSIGVLRHLQTQYGDLNEARNELETAIVGSLLRDNPAARTRKEPLEVRDRNGTLIGTVKSKRRLIEADHIKIRDRIVQASDGKGYIYAALARRALKPGWKKTLLAEAHRWEERGLARVRPL